jgi:hypothetical protein
VAVFVQRAQIPSLGGGWILRPSTKRGGASSPAAGGTATLASTRFLGSVVVDLIVIFPGGSGCFVLIAGFLCFFLFRLDLLVICTLLLNICVRSFPQKKFHLDLKQNPPVEKMKARTDDNMIVPAPSYSFR